MARILVIDDSKLARVQIRKMLKETRYEIVEATGGEEAIEVVKRERPDCILLDLLMPGIKGTEVLKIFREQNLNIPVIVHTANVQKTKIEECFRLGASAVLSKPNDSDEIIRTIDKVLSGGGVKNDAHDE